MGKYENDTLSQRKPRERVCPRCGRRLSARLVEHTTKIVLVCFACGRCYEDGPWLAPDDGKEGEAR